MSFFHNYRTALTTRWHESPLHAWFCALKSRGLAARARWMVALIVIGAVALSLSVLLWLTRSWMIQQIDQSLDSDMARLVETYSPDRPLDEQLTLSADLRAPASPYQHKDGHKDSAREQRFHAMHESEGTLFAVTDQGNTQAVVIQRFTTFNLQTADTTTLAALQPLKGAENTSLAAAGRYRTLTRLIDGRTYTVGQGTDKVTDIFTSTALASAMITALVVLAGAIISSIWIRRELQPLERVVGVSRTIREELTGTTSPETPATTTTNLDKTTQPTSEHAPLVKRVTTTDLRPNSEVADVAHALNALLDTVSESLDAKERSLEQLRQFVADASHELRTPLASIRGYTQLLTQGAIKTSAALERITSESTRMSDLVEDLLLLARLDAGRPLNAAPVDPLPIAVESLADANAAAPTHHWNLHFDPNTADSCLVLGDEAAVRQVFANLLANARHHTPSGTTVHIDIARVGDTVLIDVSDNGPGIPASIRDTLFDRFVRGEESRSRENGGSSGLGLSIVHALVTEMGGNIRLESPDGEGARFLIAFPSAPQS